MLHYHKPTESIRNYSTAELAAIFTPIVLNATKLRCHSPLPLFFPPACYFFYCPGLWIILTMPSPNRCFFCSKRLPLT